MPKKTNVEKKNSVESNRKKWNYRYLKEYKRGELREAITFLLQNHCIPERDWGALNKLSHTALTQYPPSYAIPWICTHLNSKEQKTEKESHDLKKKYREEYEKLKEYVTDTLIKCIRHLEINAKNLHSQNKIGLINIILRSGECDKALEFCEAAQQEKNKTTV